MLRLLLTTALCLSVALAAGAQAASSTSTSERSIEEFIDEAMPPSAVPGVAYAVVDGGTVKAVAARGVVRLGGDTAVTPDTPFVIGSITKSFTALAVMQLVEAGAVGLDTAISHYLDEFAGEPAGAITIRQLLSHTSGYSTLQGNAGHPDAGGDKEVLARGVDRLAQVTPAYLPGERWQYSNANYEILGRLIEVVSGQEYQAYVATNILEPVGMSHSFVADGEVHASMASGHRPWFGRKLPISGNTTDRGTAPQGGIVASAGDMALYLQMMMNGEDDVLSADGKAQMMRPASAVSPSYGFGWNLASDAGAVWHSGVTPGIETLATLLPAEKKAVIVLANGGSGMGFGETNRLRIGISDMALGLDSYDAGTLWTRQALFLGLALLPFVYLYGMVIAWIGRAKVRAKRSNVPGLFSLWFPLLTTGVAAWALLFLVPSLMGSPLRHWSLFQPDVVLVFVASAVMGVLWALFRLALAYIGVTPTQGSKLAASQTTGLPVRMHN